MSIIDRQRSAAAKALEAMGYAFAAGEWQRPVSALDARAACPTRGPTGG